MKRKHTANELQIERLRAEIKELQDQGECYLDAWVSYSVPAGTARTSRSHAQLRSRLAQFNGKKSRYLKRHEVKEADAACERGRQIKKLQKLIEKLCASN